MQSRDIAAAARALIGAADNALAQAMIHRFAMEQLNLVRVQRVRRDLLDAVIRPGQDTARLAALEKYERRTRSRRKFAMRGLAALRTRLVRAGLKPGPTFPKRTEPEPDAT